MQFDKVSGSFVINSGPSLTLPTRVVAIPATARAPAGLTVRNLDPAAVMYLKWVPIGSGASALAVSDCPIRLEPGVSYTWDSPPFGSQLFCLSTIPDKLLGVDGSWGVAGGEGEMYGRV